MPSALPEAPAVPAKVVTVAVLAVGLLLAGVLVAPPQADKVTAKTMGATMPTTNWVGLRMTIIPGCSRIPRS